MKRIITILFALIGIFAIVRMLQPEDITVDISDFPFEELLQEIDSPDGKYKIRLYRIAKDLKETDNKKPDVYVRLYYNKEKDELGNEVWLHDNSKIIYYKEDCKEGTIQWVDHNTVYINEEKLTVPHEIYDSRR